MYRENRLKFWRANIDTVWKHYDSIRGHIVAKGILNINRKLQGKHVNSRLNQLMNSNEYLLLFVKSYWKY